MVTEIIHEFHHRVVRCLLLGLLACSLGGASGCGNAGMTAYQSTQQPTAHDGRDLYLAAVRTLAKLGYGLAARDESAMVIETDYMKVNYDAMWGGYYRYSWRIITSGGELTIFSSCFLFDGIKAGERDCGGQRPASVVAEEKRIADMILADVSKL